MSNIKSISKRQYLGREAWIKHIADYKSSGLSQSEYAKQHGLVDATFKNWIQKLRREARESANTVKPQLVPVKVNLADVNAMDLQQGLSFDIEITLPNGIQCTFTPQHRPNLILPWIDYLKALP
jgi:hypothetical protein